MIMMKDGREKGFLEPLKFHLKRPAHTTEAPPTSQRDLSAQDEIPIYSFFLWHSTTRNNITYIIVMSSAFFHHHHHEAVFLSPFFSPFPFVFFSDENQFYVSLRLRAAFSSLPACWFALLSDVPFQIFYAVRDVKAMSTVTLCIITVIASFPEIFYNTLHD